MKKFLCMFISIMLILVVSVPVYAVENEETDQIQESSRERGYVLINAVVPDGFDGPIRITLQGAEKEYTTDVLAINQYEDKVFVPFGEYEVTWIRIHDNINYMATANVREVVVSAEQDGSLLITVEAAPDVNEAANYESESLANEESLPAEGDSDTVLDTQSTPPEGEVTQSAHSETIETQTTESEDSSQEEQGEGVNNGEDGNSFIRNLLVSSLGTLLFVGFMVIVYVVGRKIQSKL